MIQYWNPRPKPSQSNYCGFIEVFKDHFFRTLNYSKIVNQEQLNQSINANFSSPFFNTVAVFKIRLKNGTISTIIRKSSEISDNKLYKTPT